MLEDFTFAIILSILAALSWGINSHILKIGAQGENPMLALTYRAIVTIPILIPLAVILRGVEVLNIYFSGNFLFLILLMVISILIGDGIFIYSLKTYPVSLILPIASSYPLITIIILIATKSENVTPLVLGGTLLIVTGIAIVTSNGSLSQKVPKKAVFMGIGVAIGWGGSVFFAKLILEQEGSESLGLMVVRTILIGIISFLIFVTNSGERMKYKQREFDDKKLSFKIFAVSGLFGWVFGATLLFLAIDAIGAAIPTPISSTNPIIAVFIGHFLAIDKITRAQFLGILVTTLGAITILI